LVKVRLGDSRLADDNGVGGDISETLAFGAQPADDASDEVKERQRIDKPQKEFFIILSFKYNFIQVILSEESIKYICRDNNRRWNRYFHSFKFIAQIIVINKSVDKS